jgi:diguanylate cyclase (GGDEF)-like protein/PAS domain S-box-containing protein
VNTHDFKQAYAGINIEDSLENILMHAFESTNNGILVVDAATRIIAINPAFTRITGYEPDEVIGKQPSILNSGRQNKRFYESMWNHLKNFGHWEGEIWNRRKNGEIYPEWLNIVSVNNNSGDLQYYVGIFCDISAIKSHEDKLIELAFYDPLTSLPNRVLFHDRLNQTLAHARRDNGHFAVLFIDLDGFKRVNDSFGHLAGDAVLLETAGRLNGCVRTSDTVARLAGDEFIIIAEKISCISDIAKVARNILDVMAQDFDIQGHDISCGASIGIAVYPESGTDTETLIKHADMAMYEAKQAGKNAFHFHASTTLRQNRQQPQTITRNTYPPAADLHIKKSGT